MSQTELITKQLDGKIAVITGGNSGIGLATAQRIHQPYRVRITTNVIQRLGSNIVMVGRLGY